MARNPWPENDLARAVMTNPVGTERAPLPGAPSMGMPRGPFNELMAMGPGGQPMMATDLDRAYAQRHEGAETAMGLVMGMTGNAPGSFRAFHGSPHSFERFDSSKIGTGEGAQAYGHGLYFAEKEGVAKGYRDKLMPGSDIGDLIDKHGGDANAALTELINKGYTSAELDAVLKYQKTGERPPKGSMYEVQVNADPAHFLDWDKPLSQQSPKVQEALRDLNIPNMEREHVTGKAGYFHLAGEAVGGGRSAPGGSAAMIEAAQRLQKAGIPGIRYLDQGSRGAPQGGTRNLVVFDDATIEILRKYGIAGLIAGGAGVAGAQQ